MPYLRVALIDWLRAPAGPTWFFDVLWFSIFTFVAIPFSIVLGGLPSVPVRNIAG